MIYNQIKGSGGGGGKGGGGGSVRTPVEAPNTLQSVQYARLLDLVSEGEIEGLVSGLQSVFIDDTPLLNSAGNYNFSGVSFDYRKGTQSQSNISGFPSVENEVQVSTEITYNQPVVRSITNTNIDAARLTVSVPSLTSQNTTNGDLNGTSVTLKVEYQNNSGGWIPARVSEKIISLSNSGNTLSSGGTNILSANFNITWAGIVDLRMQQQYCYWRIDYRDTSSGTWTALTSGVFNGQTKIVQQVQSESNTSTYVYPTASNSIVFSGRPEAAYEFRIVKTSGVGVITFSSATANCISPEITISGKTVSKYQRSYRLELPSPGPWDIKISRVTPDSSSSALQNKTFFDSYTEIVDAKLSYPNSAVFGIQIDARQFSSVPSRAYEIYGIKVKVPENYDPITRQYSGTWSGNFKIAWSNNPAWIFYDIITNDRYGLGSFINQEAIDKWGLYNIAQYCDEFIPDGFGGTEPRFTCNVYIQTRSEAYNLITQLASVFRSMVFWSQGEITCVQDSPSDCIALFTAANVIDGVFNYSGSSVKSRHTVCTVTWNDPQDRYKQKVEYVEDQEGIARYGVIQTEVQAFGCTSRGQAHRVGKWLLLSEKLETETISFKTGINAALVYPGAIIRTQDQFRSGKRFGGRLFNSTTTELNLDSNVTIEPNKSYEISVVLPDGSVHSSSILNTPGTYSSILPSIELPSNPVNAAIWVLSASDLKPEEWRVISIAEAEPGIVEITALASRQDKYAAVENNLVLTPIPTTSVVTGGDAISNLSVSEDLYLVTPTIVGNSATVSWTGNSASYILSYYKEGLNPLSIEVRDSSYTINGITPGIYIFTVQPVNALGRRGESSYITKEIYGLSVPPSDVSNFNLAAIAGSAHITFNSSTDLDVKIGGYLRVRHSKSSSSWNDAIDLGVHISGTATSAVVPLLQGRYFAKWVDSTGNESVNAVSILTDAPSIINLNVAETINESPSFSGARDGVSITTFAGEAALTLDSQLTIDEILDLVDTLPNFEMWGGLRTSGEYIFANNLDLGSVFTSRVTADIESFGINSSNIVDYWSTIDDLLSVDASVISDVSSELYLKKSNDGITYSEWEPFMVGDYTARAFQFKLVLNSTGYNNISVTKCSVQIDMPDTVQSQEDIVSTTGITKIVYPATYYRNPSLGITAQNMNTGDYYEITDKTNQGFNIVFKNASGTAISRTFDYIAKGY